MSNYLNYNKIGNDIIKNFQNKQLNYINKLKYANKISFNNYLKLIKIIINDDISINISPEIEYKLFIIEGEINNIVNSYTIKLISLYNLLFSNKIDEDEFCNNYNRLLNEYENELKTLGNGKSR